MLEGLEIEIPHFPHTKRLLQNIFGATGSKSIGDIAALYASGTFIQSHYPGLSRIQAIQAMRQYAPSARIVDTSLPEDRDLAALLDEAFDEIPRKKLLQKPKLILCESDFPVAMALPSPQGDAIILSENLLTLLNNEEIKACLGRECLHLEDAASSTRWQQTTSKISSRMRERELKADEWGALTSGGPKAMKSAMLKIEKRNDEIGQWKKAVLPVADHLISAMQKAADQFLTEHCSNYPLVAEKSKVLVSYGLGIGRKRVERKLEPEPALPGKQPLMHQRLLALDYMERNINGYRR